MDSLILQGNINNIEYEGETAEIRFINGEVNFNDEPRGLWRGLWMGMCIMIFGERAKIGTHSIIDYRSATGRCAKGLGGYCI